MKKVTLLILGVLALGVSATVFAAEQGANFLTKQPIEVQKYIIYFIVHEKDFITAANNAEELSWTNKKYRSFVINTLKNRFKNQSEAQDELLKLSQNGKLTPFALTILLTVGANLNVTDKFDRTALKLAAKNGHIEIARMLEQAIEKQQNTTCIIQ